MHNQERAQCAFGEEARVHARVLGCQRGRKMKSTHHKNAFLCAQPDVSLSPSGVIIIHEATLFCGSIALLLYIPIKHRWCGVRAEGPKWAATGWRNESHSGPADLSTGETVIGGDVLATRQ